MKGQKNHEGITRAAAKTFVMDYERIIQEHHLSSEWKKERLRSRERERERARERKGRGKEGSILILHWKDIPGMQIAFQRQHGTSTYKREGTNWFLRQAIHHTRTQLC